MDIASTVGSEITAVDFGFLSSAEISKLSVKQITNPEVFDNLGHPVAGGLYDLALGAFLKNLCGTCGLDDRYCMGHIGHIDLPIPVYNPMFFSHMYVLLRSACLYCHRFRLRYLETHLFECKLKLLQYGLVLEASDIEDLSLSNASMVDPEAGELPNEKDNEKLIEARNKFVEQAIAAAIASGQAPQSGVRTPNIFQERKNVIKQFYSRLLSRAKCDNCGMFSPKFRKDGLTKIFETALSDRQINHNRVKGLERRTMVFSDKTETDIPTGEEELITEVPKVKERNGNRFILSNEVCNILRALFRREQDLCKALFQSNPNSHEYVSGDMFFVHKVVVPPTRFRLPSQLGEEVHANPMNELLSNILTSCLRIRDLSEEIDLMTLNKQGGEQRKLVFTQLMNQFVTLQGEYNGVIDSTKNQNSTAKALALPGIKQTLERKEGLFRKNMMGKRVNYAARSVISPDPNIETNEIGIPPVFAVKLTYPEPVTSYNYEEMRQAVINGPDVWPGATMIQNEDGKLVSLATMTVEQRTALANQLMTPSATLKNPLGVNKKVYRHIRNHDVVLMNRQPTLHKASMMGHNVRVLPKEKTLRLHYANTGAYNADFDGDEMNMHFPQNEAARAEALLLANTNSQYLTPTSGKPLRGLIQDHISAGVWLTNKDTFFSREQYQQLVYGAIRPENGQFTSDRVLQLPPAIVKPRPMWTGKQVISTILLNVKPAGRPGLNLTAKNKIKNEYWGPHSEENLVIVHDGELVSGILDKSQYGAADYGLVHACYEVYGPDNAGLLLSVLGRLFTKYNMDKALTCGMDDLRLTEEGDKWRVDLLQQAREVGLQAAIEVTNMPEGTKEDDPELKKRLEEILRDDEKLGILDAITQSKANSVTSKVVSTCIPNGSEKLFPRNSMQAMALSGAKGSNVNVSQIMCGLGQQALEGRRVPVMVSGKTLPSFKPFETNVRAGGYIAGRFYSGIKPQEYYFHCMAGREGLIDTAVKTSRSGYLQRCLIKQLEGVKSEYDNTVRDSDGSIIQFMYGGDNVDPIKESYLKEFEFCSKNYETLLLRHSPEFLGELNDTDAMSYSKKARKHLKKSPESAKYDPVLSVYNPGRYLGSVSERFQDDLDEFIESHKNELKHKAPKFDRKFRSLMQLKYQQSLVNPGDCVGIIASQSIGEPSTQMTLNTFHFAGHGAANVTLGIPRLREIIMTASAHIRTPQMTMPINANVSDEHADFFCKNVTRLMLSQLIDNIVVTERTGPNVHGQYVRQYTIRVNLYTREEYETEYDVSQREVETVLSNKFLMSFEDAVVKELRKQKKSDSSTVVGKSVKKTDTASTATKKKTSENLIDDEALESGEEDIDSDAEDADEDSAKAHIREEEEENESPVEDSESEDEDLDEVETESESEEDEGDAMEVDSEPIVKKPTELSLTAKQRQDAVIQMHRTVTKFNFDDEMGEWCEYVVEYPASTKKLLMVNLLEDVCRKVVVREVPKIERCLRPSKHDAGRVLVTEGVNFGAMWLEDLFIDVNGIMSNDVSAVLHTYGVEAARATIVREVSNVFRTYSIAVNPRHLGLIADTMTREGTYLPFSRQGLDSSVSPFQKMSFESTCQFLTKTVLDGNVDSLENPSARIVVGRPMQGGTGSFDLFTKVGEVSA